ncbi:hypothetical protein [uncultured Sphingomonas sp.]|uniref:hypothetical protein n=1 Tax=uncultured Sphingomonas sp. TaxID=158754 RepID=UPI0035CB1202
MAAPTPPRNPRAVRPGPGTTRCVPPAGQAAIVVRLASRLRATNAAAAPPNRKIIGGAGTGAGGPPVDPVLPELPVEL